MIRRRQNWALNEYSLFPANTTKSRLFSFSSFTSFLLDHARLISLNEFPILAQIIVHWHAEISNRLTALLPFHSQFEIIMPTSNPRNHAFFQARR
jgi:hypothetical protein